VITVVVVAFPEETDADEVEFGLTDEVDWYWVMGAGGLELEEALALRVLDDETAETGVEELTAEEEEDLALELEEDEGYGVK